MDTSIDAPALPDYNAIPQLADDKAQASAAAGAVDSTEGEISDLAKQQAQEVSGREQQLQSMQPPQQMIGYTMKQAPILMALSALMGGHSKTFGLTALGSLNGMVQGTMKGAQDEYKDAEAKYQQALDQMKQQWAMRDQVYASLEKAYGTTMQGNLRRWQIANAAVGLDEKQAESTFKDRLDIAKLEQKAVSNENTRMHEREMERIAAINAGAHATAAGAAAENADTRANAPPKTGAGSAKEKQADEFASSMESKIDTAINLIKTHPNTTGMAGKLRGMKETVAGAISQNADSSAHLVDQQLTQIQADAVKLSGMRPGIKSMEEFANVVGSQGWGSSDANVLAKLESLKQELEKQKNGGKTNAEAGTFNGPVADVGTKKQVPDMNGHMITVTSLGNGKWQQTQ